jgi:hypothetical protein
MSFLPWLAGRNEDDLIELQASTDLARSDEVAMVDWVKRAAHDTEPVSLVRVGAALSGQARGPRWQGHKLFDAPAGPLAVGAALADRPGDQQQDEKQAEREDSEGPGRNGKFAGRFGLEKRQCQGHTRSVAAQSSRWVAEPWSRGLTDPYRLTRGFDLIR